MKLKKKFILKLLPAVALLSMLASGCNTSGCTDNRSSIPLAGFYSSADGKPIAVDSLAIKGVGAPVDTIYLLSPSEIATQVYLPLRATESSTTFEIFYMQSNLAGLTDRVTIDYNALPYFASEECGAMYRYRIIRLNHTSVLLDSVGIVPEDSVITNAPVQNLHLYFRTSSQDPVQQP